MNCRYCGYPNAPDRTHCLNCIQPLPKKNEYPSNWEAIAANVKDKAGWRCERCKHRHDLATAHVLTVHHLDGDKANCEEWNLAALCQRCHLRVQGRVKMDQLFFMEILDVAEWFKPHLRGYLAAKSIATPFVSYRTPIRPKST